jgi:hypothetical protein
MQYKKPSYVKKGDFSGLDNRSAGNPHAAFDEAGDGNGVT